MLAVNWTRVQERLHDLGFNPGPIDGIRGPKTDAAIVAFKRSVGLRARSYFGPLTHAALFAKEALEDAPSKQAYGYLAIARQLLGVHERRNHSRLKSWLYSTVAWIDPRSIPWCGAYVETVLRMWGETKTVKNPLGARQWLEYGKKASPQRGAILIFWRGSKRGWQGHVGFYWGEDATHYYVLGGNQSNAVTVTRIAKFRLLGAVMPLSVVPKGERVWMNAQGIPVSYNEA